MTKDPTPPTPDEEAARAISPAVQILSIIFYTGFAISVSIVAMVLFGLIGVALAVFFAWQWARMPVLGACRRLGATFERLGPDVPETTRHARSSESFESYRGDVLQRLETEQSEFDGFVTRLRTAKDASEFDRFLDDRAAAHPVAASRPAEA